MNDTYDALVSEYDFKDFSFSKLRERYKVWTYHSMEETLFDSLGLRDESGKLTNAGALLADACPLYHSRLFCSRWGGLSKCGDLVDAYDSGEYTGSLIILLEEGIRFIRRHTSMPWKKTACSRIEMPDYRETSVFEALVNALVHRDYYVTGAEVHVDIYDDRLTITSPGRMAFRRVIPEEDILNASPFCPNPVLANVFTTLGYMEQKGNGLKKIIESYELAPNYREEVKPKFFFEYGFFKVTLYNLNYGLSLEEIVALSLGNQAIWHAFYDFDEDYTMVKKVRKVFGKVGRDGIFSRSDVSAITGDSLTDSSNLILNLRKADLVEPVHGHGNGKYRFNVPEK